MARRYRVVEGIGPCSVGLRGVSANGRISAQLLTHAKTGAIYVLFNEQQQRTSVPVTSMPPYDLLDRLAKFEWRYGFDTVDESE